MAEHAKLIGCKLALFLSLLGVNILPAHSDTHSAVQAISTSMPVIRVGQRSWHPLQQSHHQHGSSLQAMDPANVHHSSSRWTAASPSLVTAVIRAILLFFIPLFWLYTRLWRRKLDRSPILMASYTAQDTQAPDERFAFAPMMDYTSRHFRLFARLLSRRAVVYTEMVSSNTLLSRPEEGPRRLSYNDVPWADPTGITNGSFTEHPVVLQLGGSNPEMMEKSCELAAPYGYDMVNLNCGCPSPGVADSGCFGAALMRDPSLVSDVVLAMRSGLTLGGRPATPVSIKCRLGVDDDFPDVETTYDNLVRFVDTLSNGPAQVQRFQVHARKAVLGRKLKAKENRKVPLRYEWVSQLSHDFPNVEFVLNGGLKTVADIQDLLDEEGPYRNVRGVMCGRATIDNPWQFSVVDDVLYHDKLAMPNLNRRQLLTVYGTYCDRQEEESRAVGNDGIRRALLKPLLNLFTGEHHGRRWSAFMERAVLDEQCSKMPLSEFLVYAMHQVSLTDEALDRMPGQPKPDIIWSGSDVDEEGNP